MEAINTIYSSKAFRSRLFPTLGFLLIAFLISSCASSLNKEQDIQAGFGGDKSFSFKEDGSNWRVDFKDDDISSVYKNGERIPDNEIDQHKEMIYKKLDELRSDYKDFSGKVHRFYFDSDRFKNHMKKFKRDFDNEKFWRFKLEFDQEDFEKNMKELEEQLKELKDKKIELYFDSESFKEKMKELEENLKNIPKPPDPPDVDIDIYFDKEKFKDGMKKLEESIKLHKFDIDSSVFDMKELKKSMKDLRKNLKGLKIEISGVKTEMKKLNQFLEELKTELIKDGYLNSEEEDYSLEISDSQTKVNGTVVKQSDHEKYKELYKKIFKKDIEGKIKIEND